MALFRFQLLVLLTVLSQNVFSQLEIDNYGKKVRFYKTKQIEYAVYGELDKNKSTVFFIEGSLPTSSYFKYKDTVYYTGPNEIMDLSIEFNLIILGKPAVPILIDYGLMNDDLVYRDSNGLIPKDYLLNDNIDFYTESYSSIVNQLVKDFNLNDLYIFGHSQGSRIAAELALSNDNIKGVILSSIDPLGRIATMIDKSYANFEKKDKTKFLQSVIRDGTNSLDSTFMESTYYSWQSFSYPLIITMSKIEKPILMAYGTVDLNCPNCYIYSYLVTYIPNFDFLSYEGYNHNFFDNKGNKQWGEVIRDVECWIKSK